MISLRQNAVRAGLVGAAIFGSAVLGIGPAGAAPPLYPDVIIKLVNEHSGMCLDITGGSTSVGGRAIQAPCSSATSQQWIARNVENSGNYMYYDFINRHSNLSLSVPASSTANDVVLVQSGYSPGSHDQQWWMNSIAGHNYFVNRNSGKCIEEYGNSTAAGALATQYTCNQAVGEQWKVVSVS